MSVLNFRRFMLAGVAILAFGGRVPAARAQEIPPIAQEAPAPQVTEAAVTLTPAQARRFQTALTSLGMQAHVAFLAEGVPIHPTLTEMKASELAGTLSLSQAVSKVADAFDYDATRQGGVFVLKKRYTDPHDLPSVTLGEYAQAMQDVAHLLEVFNPHIPEHVWGTTDPLIADLVPTLTPEQLQAMQETTPDRALRVASLSPMQQEQVRRLALYLYVQTGADDARHTLFALQQAPQGDLCIGKQFGNGQPRFGYEMSFQGRPEFRVLEVTGKHLLNGREMVSRTDAPDLKEIAAADGTTLGHVISVLKPADGRPASVDPALAAKSVTAANVQAAPPLDVLRGLAGLYGLRIGANDSGGPLLERPALAPPGSIADLPALLHRVFPDPLLRAVHDVSVTPVRKITPMPPVSTPAFWTWAHALDRADAQDQERQQAPQWMYQEVVRRLRAAYDARQKATGGSGRVPVSSLAEPEREEFALALALTAMQTLASQYAAAHVPLYITNFNDLYLTGDSYQATDGTGTKFRLQLQIYNPQSNALQMTTMISNVQYIPR